MKKKIAIIGSTGSIGTQALEVIRAHRSRFAVEVLTALNNADLLIKQAIEYRPKTVVIVNDRQYKKVCEVLLPFGIEVQSGRQALASIVQKDEIDVVLMALVGCAGLLPTIQAIRAGKSIALANKEVLVIAGELITQLLKKHGVNLYPIDSEHSAIFQCLMGEEENSVEKVILTASGGPFFGKCSDELENVTREQALKHPNWTMGDKITIDSATLMNKGLEVIEAKWLFGLQASQIEVVIHPQSIIHSMVQFHDGSVKSQLGVPDMRMPIQVALAYPERIQNNFHRLDFDQSLSLTFSRPDTKTFRNLALAYEALHRGGNSPCILNAANEVAVSEFMKATIRFLDIPKIVEKCMKDIDFVSHLSYDDYMALDKETRIKALEFAKICV